MEKKIFYDPNNQTENVSGGTMDSPINFEDVREHLNKDPHYILDNLKKKRPEVYRHIVGLLISFYKD